MTNEPFGHRGHPSSREQTRAAYLAERLTELVERLVGAGAATEEEALALIAGIAYEKASRRGETWGTTYGAIRTVRAIFSDGRNAKEWSMDAIALTVVDLEAEMFGLKRDLP